jgi:cytoskeletal protein RodZ
VRGYLRSYGKLLHIPELDIKQAMELIKPQPVSQGTPLSLTPKPAPLLTSSHYFMQLFTYLIVFTLIGLVGTWWYMHSANPSTIENQLTPPEATAITLPTTPITSPTPIAKSTPAAATRVTHQDEVDEEDDSDTNRTVKSDNDD